MHPQPPRRTTHATANPKTQLVYDRWGQFGRPVVLLHGLLFDRTMWWPLAAELAATASCTIVAADLPGHGQSPHRDDCRLEVVARDLAGLVHRLGLHRAPIVVGHATSAPLAAAFADAYATRHVLTVDEAPTTVAGVDDVLAAARLDAVPEHYRPYAQARREPALLGAYASWLVQPSRRNRPALVGRAGGWPSGLAGPFAHLTAPEAVAAELRELL